MDVARSAADNYDLNKSMEYLVLYEFDQEFIDYMNDEDTEKGFTSMPRNVRLELQTAVNELIGDQVDDWTLWEEEQPDDVAEIYGGLQNNKFDLNGTDAIVEIYSGPRVAAEAAARGLQASLSVDLKTNYDLTDESTKERVKKELRRRRPKLLVTSPPCTKFSPLQNLRQHPERLQEELPEAIAHVDFSMELQLEQLDRGDHGLHEHPDTATSWTLPSVEKFIAQDNVKLVKSHLCRFGLQVGSQGLNKKSTLFATSSDATATKLQKQCVCAPGSHEQLLSGKPHLAEEYPPALVRAIVDGLRANRQNHNYQARVRCSSGQENYEKHQWFRFMDHAVLVCRGTPEQVPRAGPRQRNWRWTWALNPWDNKSLQIERGVSGKWRRFEAKYKYLVVMYSYPIMQESYVEESVGGITNAEKAAVMRCHINLGHPQVKEFIRLLKTAGTRKDVVDYVIREFRCEGCQKEQRQPTRLPSATSQTYDFNVVVGIDVLFIYGTDDRAEHPILNVTCVGALYSTFTMVNPNRRTAELVWSAFALSWLRTFTSPSYLIHDQGNEFVGANFQEGLEQHGIQPLPIARDAPFQNWDHGEERRPLQAGVLQDESVETSNVTQGGTRHDTCCVMGSADDDQSVRLLTRTESVWEATLDVNGADQRSQTQSMDQSWKKAEEIRAAARKALVDQGQEGQEKHMFSRMKIRFMFGEKASVVRRPRSDHVSWCCKRVTLCGSPRGENYGSATRRRCFPWATSRSKAWKLFHLTYFRPRRS